MDYKKINSHIILLGIVIVVGLLAAIIVRLSILENGADIGTENLTFLLVLAVSVVLYLIIIATLSRYIVPWLMKLLSFLTKKSIPQEMSEPGQGNAAVKTEEAITEPEEEWICDNVIPEIGDYEEADEEADEEAEPIHIPAPKNVQPNWKELHEKEIQSKLSLFLEYSHLAIGPYVAEDELDRLDGYIELFAREAELAQDVKPIKPAKLKNPDLYHFGWNMQYYFQVGKREDVVPWLKKVFVQLGGIAYSSIKSKLHDYQTKKYIIPNIDDIPKYMAEKRA